MYMDLTDMISGGMEEQQVPEQKLTKEEYAAKKQQEREEVWAEVDSQAQGVFQDGEKLKGFLDFMAECNTQRTPNLLLIYGQHPDFKVVRSYERWREEHRSVKAGEHGITYMISTEYEKDGEMRRGYTIGKGFDISQMSGKPLEERPQRSLTELVGVVLKDQSVRVQIEDNLPDKVQAQYNPRYRTIYIRNGMSEVTTFHALNRELACAAMDQHTGTYSRQSNSCFRWAVGIDDACIWETLTQFLGSFNGQLFPIKVEMGDSWHLFSIEIFRQHSHICKRWC